MPFDADNTRQDSREASPLAIASDPYQYVYQEDSLSNEPECIKRWREEKDTSICDKENAADKEQKY
ncbi:hypothetical protein, partial [Salmonella sp. s51228]|uniref:hypothetical protein n=1 Tax=Salmonella sp. s51228 TaxID=3159652 RepID=UPI0039806958